MDPWNQRQHLPPPPSINPFIMQQLLELQANAMPWSEVFYGLPFCTGPVYQGMAQQHQHQYRAPSSGPCRNQRSKGSRKAEAQFLFHISHESSGTIAGDRSTSIHPGYARIGANNNTGAQKMRTKPYNRDRSSRTRRKRTDEVDPSVYEIHILKSKRGATACGQDIPTPAPAMLPTWTTAPAPSTPASAASTSTAYTESTSSTRNTNAQKRPVEEEEEDFDTISLGSNTD